MSILVEVENLPPAFKSTVNPSVMRPGQKSRMLLKSVVYDKDGLYQRVDGLANTVPKSSNPAYGIEIINRVDDLTPVLREVIRFGEGVMTAISGCVYWNTVSPEAHTTLFGEHQRVTIQLTVGSNREPVFNVPPEQCVFDGHKFILEGFERGVIGQPLTVVGLDSLKPIDGVMNWTVEHWPRADQRDGRIYDGDFIQNTGWFVPYKDHEGRIGQRVSKDGWSRDKVAFALETYPSKTVYSCTPRTSDTFRTLWDQTQRLLNYEKNKVSSEQPG